ncbi:DUF5979 domain-containing protein [Corynebacterium sp.]|uniref:DUF5979 domain-containing protein n=1 Tax=Corynebacterium sp. TaxID=1720 RepID=UPI0026E032A3|nr:DUF5979 domain-containing protein [Corynebacterium sp.]MDO5512739.1 DUF5979 domain-containing protein [Corynebacterium sp.]
MSALQRHLTRGAALFLSMLLGISLLAFVPATPVAQAQTPPTTTRPQVCGGGVAFLVDSSYALLDLYGTATAGDINEYKSELKTAISRLADTGAATSVGVYSYEATTPPSYNSSLNSQPIDSPAGVRAASNHVDSLRSSTAGRQAHRNWEGGLAAIRRDIENGAPYSTIYLLTESAPTADNTGANGNTLGTSQQEVDRALAEKARIEALGVSIVPIGLGNFYNNPFPQSWWLNIEGGGRMRYPEFLEQFASPGVTFPNPTYYNNVASRINPDPPPACLRINKEIVDAAGTVQDRPEGWEFETSVSGAATLGTTMVTTRTDGRADLHFPRSSSGTMTITMQEQPQSGFALQGVTCTAHAPTGGTRALSPRVTESTAVVTARVEEFVDCTFRNEQVVPLRLGKQVSSETDAVLEEVLKEPYNSFDFEWTCRVGNRVVGQGNTTLQDGEVTTLSPGIPVGAQCEITEEQPRGKQNYFSGTPTWRVQNGSSAQTSEDNLTYTFTVSPSAAAQGVEVTTANVYTAEEGVIRLSTDITNADDEVPVAALPAAVSVTYSCRYIPDPNAPPEQGDDPTDIPGYVAEGTVRVARGEVVELGPFPVGTQCTYTVSGESGASASIPGYGLETQWESNVCMRPGATGNLTRCDSNFTYLASPGTFDLVAAQTYTQLHSTLEITKTLSGDAVELGRGHAFDATVVCTRPHHEDVVLSTTLIESQPRNLQVPAASTCTIAEPEDQIPGVSMTASTPGPIDIRDPNTTYRAEINNELTFLRGPLTVTVDSNFDGVGDPLTVLALQTKSVVVIARCQEPGTGEPQEYRQEGVLYDATVTFPDLPVGTSCVMSVEEPDLSDTPGVVIIDGFSNANPVIDSPAGAAITLNVDYEMITNKLVVEMERTIGQILADQDSLVPEQFQVSFQCASDFGEVIDGTRTLASGDRWTIDGVPFNSTCTFTQVNDPAPGYTQSTTWTPSPLPPEGAGEGPEWTIVFRVQDQAGGFVRISNHFEPIKHDLTLSKVVQVVDDSGQTVGAQLRDAVIPANTVFGVRVTCTRTDQQVVNHLLSLTEANAGTVAIPEGAECELVETPYTSPVVGDPEVTFTGGGGTLDGSSFRLPAWMSAGAVELDNKYTVGMGGFGIKKKVDGEGVATIPGTKPYVLNYRCTIGGSEVVQGSVTVGRYDDPSQITGIPVGAHCEFTEDAASAREDYAQWGLRWTIANDREGRGVEQPCLEYGNCTPGVDSDGNSSATVTIVPGTTEDFATDNYQGTIVAWNTYTYEKTTFTVAKQLAGDGIGVAEDEEFVFDYTCHAPGSRDASGPQGDYVRALAVSGAMTVAPGQVVSSKPVPVYFECDISERSVPTYGGTLAVTWDNATVTPPGDVTSPREGTTGHEATFTITPAALDEPLHVTTTNNYTRPRAEFSVAARFDDTYADTVHPYVSQGPFTITWTCEDPAVGRTYTGSVQAPSDGAAVAITRDRDTVPEGTDPRIPAGSVCAVSINAAGMVPAGFEDTVEVTTTGVHRTTTAGAEPVVIKRVDGATVGDVVLGQVSDTDVSFSNGYVVPRYPMSLDKRVEGDDDAVLVGHGTPTAPVTPFRFAYTCTFASLLPGQPDPFVAEATEGDPVLVGRHDAVIVGSAPAGSTCEVRELSPVQELQDELEAANLRLQPNYYFAADADGSEDPGDSGEPAEPADPEQPVDPVEPPLPTHVTRVAVEVGEPFTLTAGPDQEGINRGQAVMVNSFFRTDGEVIIQKVNPDGTPLPGSQFAIHRAEADGMSAEPVVVPGHVDEEDLTRFTTRLVPGTYFLVETRAGEGAQLLPSAWPFTVAAVAGQDRLGDLQFQLNDFTEHSGLIEVEEPAEGSTGQAAWTIKVANIAAGEMPLTGSIGIWWLVGGGFLALVVGISWHVRRRGEGRL